MNDVIEIIVQLLLIALIIWVFTLLPMPLVLALILLAVLNTHNIRR